MMADFHFLRPAWLLLLIPAALCLWMLFKHRMHSDWHTLIPAHLATALFSEKKQRSRNYLIPLFAIVWILSVIAAAGPTWQKIEKPVFKAQLANVIVMDMSLSMRSTDVQPDRLTRSKFKAIDLAQSLGDGEVGLVAYAGDAFTISPLTQDPRNIAALIPSLSPEIMPVTGSYPYLGLQQASDLLRQAGYLSGQIYWFTDGIEQDDIDELREFAAQSPYQINVLAFGTQTGAPIKLQDGTLMKDQTGRIIMPRLTAARLKEITAVSGGLFQLTTPNDIDVKALAKRAIASTLNKKIDAADNKVTGDDWQEFGPYLILFALPAMALLFRRGIFLSLPFALLLMLPSLTTKNAIAATADKSTAISSTTQNNKDSSDTLNIFKTRDQVAQQAFNDGQFEEAKQLFENQRWRASAAYKAGDFETALELFSQDQSTEGLYNQGNALAQLGQFEDALNAYNQALGQQPDHEAALHNKSLIEKALEQQQEQQQQQDQQEQQQNQDQSQNSEQQNNDQESESNDRQESEQQKSEQDKSKPSDQAQSEQSQERNDANQESEQQSSQQQQAQQQQSESSEAEPDTKSAKTLSAEEVAEQEQQQKIQQLLRKVDDDPSILIRNKMILESRRRQQQRRTPKGVKKSW